MALHQTGIQDTKGSERVSVIVPTRNRRVAVDRYLFPGIVKQMIKPIEVIIVDQSPDQLTEEVCRRWKEELAQAGVELRYLDAADLTPSITVARDIGIIVSHGEYLLFLDDDASLLDGYIEKVLEVFGSHPNALGVGGWVIEPGARGPLVLPSFVRASWVVFAKVFYQSVASVNSRRWREQPVALTRTISCEWLGGCGCTFRRKAFREGLQFDTSMKGYALGEDMLFSYSIYRKHPGSLFLTPHARLIHFRSREGRTYSPSHLWRCLSYVYISLFGARGAELVVRERIGMFLIRKLRRRDGSARRS